jgi:cysteinyl-tRNA synthetase
MSKSLGNTLSIPSVLQRVRGIELRFYMVAAHYRSHVEFSFEALEEAAVGFRRIENFLERANTPGAAIGEVPGAFAEAMNDDLGTPAAVAVLHDTVREGNRLLASGHEDGARIARAQVGAMLDVLGLHPADPAWGPSASNDQQLTDAVDVLVRGLLDQRAQARADKDFAAADTIRDQIKAAGIAITDTPDGPTWSLEAGTK